MIKKIISGGQPGVELAALDAAIKLNIPYEGWDFQRRGEKVGLGPAPYNLKTIDIPSFHLRLEKNIINANGVVILTYGQLVLGTKIIKDLADKNQKPCLYINLTECSINHAISSIRKWIARNSIEAVYFTGSRPVGESNIYEETARIIDGIFRVESEQATLPGFEDKDDDTLL